MESNDEKSKIWAMALMAIVVLAAGIFRFAPGPATIDDAYITYRISGNIHSGNGFVYNAGERLQSSTAPLYALLLAGLRWRGGDLVQISFLLNALSGMAAAGLLFAIAKKATGNSLAAFCASFLFAICPGSVIYSASGMETSFFEMAAIAACAAFLFRKDWLATLLAGILPLIRPEGLLISMLVGVGLIVVKRKRVWVHGMVALLPLVAWAAWAWWYFGSFIPHSVSEKQRFFTDPRFAVGYLGFLRQWVYHYYSLLWGQPIEMDCIRNTKYGVMILASLPPFMGYLYQIRTSFRSMPRLLPFALAPGLYALACIIGRAGLPFPWYFMPTNGLFIAATACGTFVLARDVWDWIGNGQKWVPSAAVALGAAVVVVGHGINRYEFLPHPWPAALDRHVPPHREPVYEDVGRWLRDRGGAEDEIVLCAEVGAVGYFCPFKVWDQHLTTPRWIRERGGDLVDRYRPLYITFMGLYPPVSELADQPEEARLGKTQVHYRKVYSENRNAEHGYAARHNVVIYERQP